MEEYPGTKEDRIESHLLEGARLARDDEIEEAREHFHQALILAGYYD
jgi:Flp pilus assembly protein TadD